MKLIYILFVALFSTSAMAEMGYVCTATNGNTNSVSWGTKPCPPKTKEERVKVEEMEAYGNQKLAEMGAPNANSSRTAVACQCAAAYDRLNGHISVAEREQLAKWTFEQCHLKQISRFDCKH